MALWHLFHDVISFMRYAVEAKLVYYPTPPRVAQILTDACHPDPPGAAWTVCDPFCGAADFPARFFLIRS
jgi:hypothetical protein